jgi:protein TonB
MQVYSAAEIAEAAGVSTAQVLEALGGRDGLVAHGDAVRIGRQLLQARREPFAIFVGAASHRRRGLPFALSSSLHAGLFAAIVVVTSLGLTPRAATIAPLDRPADDMRLVFLSTPGPGGGGGGGGRRQRLPAPKALTEGRAVLSSPLPVRQPPTPVKAVVVPPEPTPPILDAEPLPVVVAPIVRAPADDRDREGVIQQTRADVESHGPGQGGGTGTGSGSGLGQGDGASIGAGSGSGTGGGPFRPGSGVVAPRLLKEVKGDYTDAARRSGVSGDVVLEIIVRRDGSVGDVRVLQGLAGGLNERAIQAVKQWRFAPATRHGAAVDVVVEVAMEFKLR